MPLQATETDRSQWYGPCEVLGYSSLGRKCGRQLPAGSITCLKMFDLCLLVLLVLLQPGVAFANTEILRFQLPSLQTGAADVFRQVEDAAVREQWKLLQPRSQQYMEVIFPRSNRFHQNTNTNQYRRWYRLAGLERNKKYEARISYAAIHPTDFSLAVLSHAEAAAILKQDSEILKDDTMVGTEKEDVQAHDNISPSQAFLLVEAKHTGVSYKIHRDMNPKTPYNIVLEPLVIGLIPEQALRLVGAIMCSILFAWNFIIPAVWRIVQRERRGKGKAAN